MTSSPKVFSLTVLFCGICFHYASASKRSFAEPYFDTVPLPPETPNPLAVNSADTQPIITLPLITYVAKNEEYNMQNMGNQIFLAAPNNTRTAIIGGVLGLVKYIFMGIVLSWNAKLGSAGTLVNGVGAPIEVIPIFLNSNYDSFEDALSHRDGIVAISNRVPVIQGGKDSAAFDKFMPYLNAILPNNASTSVPEEIAWDWFSKPFHAGYFAYAGSYVDISSGIQYPCVTAIINPLTNASKISLAQFESSFGLFTFDNHYQIQDNTGTPIVRTGPSLII